MERHKVLVLIGVVVLLLLLITLPSCVSKSAYETLSDQVATLQEEKADLEAKNAKLQADLGPVQADLDALNKVYPPRDFSSLEELQNWLLANDVSDRPKVTNAERWYSKALAIQEDALEDGYIVSADYDYDEKTEGFSVFCVTIISGDIWYWDPQTDEPLQDYSWGKVK